MVIRNPSSTHPRDQLTLASHRLFVHGGWTASLGSIRRGWTVGGCTAPEESGARAYDGSGFVLLLGVAQDERQWIWRRSPGVVRARRSAAMTTLQKAPSQARYSQTTPNSDRDGSCRFAGSYVPGRGRLSPLAKHRCQLKLEAI
jgi:hypothetical protein